MTATVRTRVAIVGAGPAGLLLSHLLAGSGIESVVVDSRTREQIESTIRAGILEQGTVEVLDTLGEFSRARTVGSRHDGIELRFAGDGHRIDFQSLVGRSVWLYPQHEALKDLIAARLADGQDLRFGVTVERVEDAETSRPRVIAADADGQDLVIEADFVVGADGSRSVVRAAVTGSSTGGYFREYPFAWFGILTEAPPERTRADLQQLPGRLRAHQPAEPDRAAHVLPVRPRSRPERADRGGDLGARCRPACPAPP